MRDLQSVIELPHCAGDFGGDQHVSRSSPAASVSFCCADSPPEPEAPQPAERLHAFTAAFDAVTHRMRALRRAAQQRSRYASTTPPP